MMWNIGYYTSPLIVTFLYRRGYFVAESIITLGKFSTGIGLLVIISLCMRGIGRSQTEVYASFIQALELAKKDGGKNEQAKEALRMFDFEFKHWPIDFSVKYKPIFVFIYFIIQQLFSFSSSPAIHQKLRAELAVRINQFGFLRCHAKLPLTLPFTHLVCA